VVVHAYDIRSLIYVELEQLAASSSRQPRFTSGGERKYLARLIAKYGSDVEAMSKDRRLNAEQKTAGELARAIRKAGGFDRVGS
jgi:nucleolar protein 16